MQSTDKKDDVSYIVVDIYKTENDEKIYSFPLQERATFGEFVGKAQLIISGFNLQILVCYVMNTKTVVRF